MPRAIDSPEEFTIVGENIHATRVLLRNGRRAKTLDDGTEVVPFRGPNGERRMLTVPEWYKSTQPYQQNQIKHFLIAMRKGIGTMPTNARRARRTFSTRCDVRYERAPSTSTSTPTRCTTTSRPRRLA